MLGPSSFVIRRECATCLTENTRVLQRQYIHISIPPQWPRPPALTGFNVGTTLRNLDLTRILSNISCAIVVTPQKQTEFRSEKNR